MYVGFAPLLAVAQTDDGTSPVDEIESAFQSAQTSGWDVFIAVMVLVAAIPVGSVVRRLVVRALNRLGNVPPILAQDVARFARLIIYLIAFAIALAFLGLDVAWVAILAIVALIITVLALRPVIENTAAALVLTNRPAFGVGDEICVAGRVGNVIEIGSHSTVLKTIDGVRIHIPNAEMLGQTVEVFTAFDARRTQFDLSVPGDTDIGTALSTIETALASADGVVADPPPTAQVSALDEDAVVIVARFWYPSTMPTDNAVTSAAIRAVRQSLVAAGIGLGGPTSAIDITGELDTSARSSTDGT